MKRLICVMLVLTMLIPATAFAANETGNLNKVKERVVKVNNEDASYFILNENRADKGTIVIAHGAFFNKKAMLPLAQSLEKSLKDYKCIVVDFPMHGSSGGEGRVNHKELGDFLQEFIEELIEEDVIESKNISVAGWSMGGVATLDLATRNLPYIESAVLIGTTSEAGENLLPPVAPEEFPFIFRQMFEQDLENLSPSEKQSILDKFDVITSFEAGFFDAQTASNFNLSKELENIEIPVLIIAGDSDHIANLENQVYMKNNINKSRLAIEANENHSFVIKQPSKVAEIIFDFITDISR